MTAHQLIQSLDITALENHINQAVNNINQNTKTILFIEPYGSTLSLLKRGFEKGYNIIIFTANSELRTVPGHIMALSKLIVQVDTANEAQVLDLAKQIHNKTGIDAVIPGFEYFVPVAAKLSEYFGLPGIDVATVLNLRDKSLMRKNLECAGINIPRYKIVASYDDLKNAMNSIGFPAVCKPVDAAGSVLVKKVANNQQAYQAASPILQNENKLWGYELSRSLLYEQYIDGKEYSVEGIISRGKVKHCSITEKFVSDESEFIEIGHIVNPPLDINLAMHIKKYVENVISVLKPDNCPFHAELRIASNGEPFLMEIAARLPGDKIGDLISLATNNNFFDDIYHAYLGESNHLDISHNATEQKQYAGIRFFYRPEIEKFTQVTGLQEAKSHLIEEIYVYYQANEMIPAFPKPLRRLGHVMMKSDVYQDLMTTLIMIDKSIIFQ